MLAPVDSLSASRKRALAFPTLGLPTQGKDPVHTKEAQFLLKDNRWGIKFYTGEIDGKFSPAVADACLKAKQHLGYPNNQVKGNFGPLLRSYLVKSNHPAYKPLPKSFLATQKKRAQIPLPVAALNRALKEVGYEETPTNITKFGKQYNENGVAWCAIFASCIIGFNRFHYSYVPNIVLDAKAGRNRLHVTEDPQPGDLVTFDWNHDGTADHVGFFGGWINQAAGEFWTCEGNTEPDNNGDQSNGGGVYKRNRFKSDVAVFVTY